MTFTNEPGTYLEGKFGVRHVDIYLVTEDGEAELLSGSRAKGVEGAVRPNWVSNLVSIAFNCGPVLAILIDKQRPIME